MATSGADINSRNFLDYDSIKDDEKLNGGLLSFEKQDDGSYLIKKDGESTGYYTTGLAAGLYMKTLVSGVSKEATAKEQSKVKNSVDTIRNIEGNQENSSSKGKKIINNIENGFSNIVDKGKDNAQNLKMNVSSKDIRGETRTIDEFKPDRIPDSSSTITGGYKKETYLGSNGTKSVFTTYNDNKQTMNIYDNSDKLLTSRSFDENGKQTEFVIFSYGQDTKAYTIKNGNLVEMHHSNVQ